MPPKPLTSAEIVQFYRAACKVPVSITTRLSKS